MSQVPCNIQPGRRSAWHCHTHNVRLGGRLDERPTICPKAEKADAAAKAAESPAMSKKDRARLEREQRFLGYRKLAGRLTNDEWDRLAEIKTLLDGKAVEA